ncbi:MAG TPA: hypothetical protein VK839_07320 [Erythrobacter sp.]|nr:hypothetical protein [Erythrobacter sp.]
MQLIKAFGGVLPAIVVFAHGSAAVAAVPPVPSAQQVEALCPGLGGNQLTFGIAEENVTEAALAQAQERAVAAGFEKAQLQYTSWSNKLYGVEYVLDVPGGDDLSDWGDLFGEMIMERGWAFSEDSFTPLSAGRYEKEIDGERVLGVELGLHSTHRGITLLCADGELQLEDQAERDGALAPGSPRPAAPPPQPPLDEFLARLDCTDPALLDLFAKAEDMDDAGALVEARLGPPSGMHAEANYQNRLVKWLRWRLLASGEIDEAALWAIEEQAAALYPLNITEGLVELMGTLGNVLEAQQSKDMGALCQAYRQAMLVTNEQSGEDARRDAALAAALEAEARRRGIAID